MAANMSEALSGAAAASDSTKPAATTSVMPPSLKNPTLRLALKLLGALLTVLLLVLILRDSGEKGQSAGGNAGTPGTPSRSTVPPGLTCSNVDIASGSRRWADTDPPPGWSVVYATVLQRHWDRWIYAHSLIHNRCWPNQLDSTAPPMPEQCGYDTDSVWERFPPGVDPYSDPPSAGSCFCPQLTLQGREHATLLGQTLRKRYGSLLESGSVACRVGAVGLETENAQKNEVSLQTAYESLCGHLPDTTEYPKSAVIWEGGLPRHGTPFFLERRICKGDGILDQLEDTATDAKVSSQYWDEAHALALEVARVSGQPPPERADSPTMLDNIEDCIVSHACHGLDDTPSEFLSSPTLFTQTDTLETTNRAWAINYFRRQMERTGDDDGAYYDFCRRYYGYYFKVVLDRMDAARSAPTGTGTRLNLQVLSDSNITPLLTMLGAGDLASRRPYWGSTLVFELWQHETDATVNHAARVIFNGQVLALGGACMGETLCEWSTWQELLQTLIPTRLQCPEFYDAYGE